MSVDKLLSDIERACYKATRKVRLDFELELARKEKIPLPEAKRRVDKMLAHRGKS